ncbi:di-trans,poly-cis-decaprenylcistransferase [Candidatus Woesearchaeota archaeon]|nr:MAG: di-trans,poly-cis-decaprenylcistransferase [Candidatus Woesearchaeota archaeon]
MAFENIDKLMPGRLAELFKIKRLVSSEGAKIPKHVAVNIAGNIRWAKNNKLAPVEGHKKGFENIKEAVRWQTERDVPVVTFYVMPEAMKESEFFAEFLDALSAFFESLHDDELIHRNQIKISVFGKWYDLPGRVIGSIKRTIEATRDYDRFFVNLCVNYDGQNEIVDACKLIIRKVQSGKIDISAVDKELIKENLYSSYFIPPELYIVFLRKSLQGHLLWDSVNAVIHFSDKLWPEASASDLDRALKFFRSVSP